jgi:acyl-CoA reductase-like NAD-dependent aldehyde dehydrogenase
MAAAADSNLKRVTLELGGKSPNVIFADADLEMAVKGATWAIFGHTGQSCTAGSRLYVESGVYDDVVPRLAERARDVRVGSGFMPESQIGPIVSEEQLQRVLGYVEQGRRDGIELVTGGERLGGPLSEGYFLPPTIFCHEPGEDSPLVREEIFGPVVAVTRFDGWEDVVARANDTRYGLAAGLWTRDVSKAHRFARAVKAGTVWINTWGQTDPAAPFGGYKESGFGREMGKEALDLYTEVKTVWTGL